MVNRSTTNGAQTTERSATAGAVESASAPPPTGFEAIWSTSPRFYVCVGILLLAAVSMQSAARILGAHFRKAPVPLKRPLDALNPGKLLPEYRPHRVQPEPLTPEVLENLGTKEYLQWNLRDRDRDGRDATAVARVFITYHTGQPDMVPHNPEECYQAGGATLRARASMTAELPGPAGGPVAIPLSVLEFEVPRRRGIFAPADGGDGLRQVVAFCFYANGKYVTSRTGVRMAVANLRDRYAYYSKIELSFTDDSFRRLANREETIEATGRLLRKLMPILWADHYQDWAALERGDLPVVLSDRD